MKLKSKTLKTQKKKKKGKHFLNLQCCRMCSASKQHSSTASHQRSQGSVVNEPPMNVSQDRLSFRSSGNCELHGVWIKGPIHLHSAQPHSWPLVIASATERHCGVCQSAEAYVLTPCHVPNTKRAWVPSPPGNPSRGFLVLPS